MGDDAATSSDDNVPLEEAVFRPSRWPGLIWTVPGAALIVIGWLGISALLNSGPSVTVTFPVRGGLRAGTTAVEYKGFTVGHVEAVKLSKSLDQTSVKIRFLKEMDGHLGPGTKYWVSGTSFSITNLSHIKSLISGPVIDVAPHTGRIMKHAKGLATAPVPEFTPPGKKFVLVTSKLPHLSSGSPIDYNGFKVGEVSGITLASGGSHFNIGVFIQNKWAHLITSKTRFWSEGAVRLAASGSGAIVHFASMPDLLSGAVAFTTPSGVPGHSVKSGTRFSLYKSKQTALDAPTSDSVAYRVIFLGGPHGLTPHAPVQLEGALAGCVTNVSTAFDPGKGRMETTVTILLKPELIGRVGKGWNLQAPRPQMNAMLTVLIRHGLRAELANSLPVVGGKLIKLAMAPDAPNAQLQPGTPPIIPSTSGGDNIGAAIASVNSILIKLNALPLTQIAANIHQASAKLAQLSTAPKTKQTLERLDRTIMYVEEAAKNANVQIPVILSEVQRSATEADAALAAIKGLTSPDGPVNGGLESSNFSHALYEISEAAKSLHALADFLNSHPNALLIGREN